ncbi:MAG TPA: hypothetical protein VH353_10800 [Caulobacteraceae bacterium]|nr:hypothetical protein [Caulobacteraceae bacterium]
MSKPQDQPHRGFPGATNPDDNLKIPRREGEPPRPATEPDHAGGDSDNEKTLTDPATGRPIAGAKDRGGARRP